MTEWKEYKLGEIGTFGNGKVRPQKQGDIPIYGGNGILGYCDEYNYCGETIIVGRVGAYCGSVYYENRPIWVSDNALALKPKNNYNTKFIYYLLKKYNLNEYAEGSSHPLVTQTLLNAIEIIFTDDIEKQIRIAAILSSLDDKIELLHRENKTLEAMAETLFRQWFIEEAKEDWKEVSLTKIANFLNGLPCQKYPPKNNIEKLPVLKIRELSNGIGKDCDWATTDIANEYIVSNGDVIFAWSASLMVKIWNGENCILNQHLFKVTSDKYPKWFYYFWCKYHLDEFITIAQSHATTMGHIKRKDLENAMVLVPTGNELKTMSKQIESLLQKIENNNNEIKTLTQTRDGLLPKLMSGEVKI
ncbi:MAG: restriction endonuclease subunit S [Bacteroidales bacterium]|nr:restriction endonuclease subunit S [Bacteroidales bacterium]